MATVTAGLPGQVTSLSACFTLQGTYTNGTSVGYLTPEDFGYGIWSVFTSQSSQAAKLGLDTITGRLVDYDGASGQQGYVASTYWDGRPDVDGRVVHDVLYFDNARDLLDPESDEHIAVVCELDSNNPLTCAHPWSPDYNIFSYCRDLGLVLGDGIDARYDCEPIALRATAAQGCSPPTSTPTLSHATTRTLTTLPTSTASSSGSQQFCFRDKTQCADGFLVRCDKNAYVDTTDWTLVGGVAGDPIGELPITSSLECHQACVERPTCMGWKYFDHSDDILYCYHTNETIPENLHFHVSDYAYIRYGVRGRCQ